MNECFGLTLGRLVFQSFFYIRLYRRGYYGSCRGFAVPVAFAFDSIASVYVDCHQTYNLPVLSGMLPNIKINI